MQSEDGVCTGRLSIQIVLANSPGKLTFEEAVESLFLRVADRLGQALDGNSTALGIGNQLQVLVASDGT